MITDKASYDKAKAELKDKQWRKDNLQGSAEFTWHMKQHITLISAALLAYRRANNIFEVRDLVITDDEFYDADGSLFQESHKINDVLIITKIGKNFVSLSGDVLTDMQHIRHATDEEIKANRRLDQ